MLISGADNPQSNHLCTLLMPINNQKLKQRKKKGSLSLMGFNKDSKTKGKERKKN